VITNAWDGNQDRMDCSAGEARSRARNRLELQQGVLKRRQEHPDVPASLGWPTDSGTGSEVYSDMGVGTQLSCSKTEAQ